MSDIQIHDIHQMALSSATREKIIKQANFAGLEQNLATGDIVTLKVGDELCQITFNKDEAIKQHRAPKCAPDEDEGIKDVSFSDREELSLLLGLNTKVSEKVFLKAKEDDVFLHNLLVTKDTPEFMLHLLKQADTLVEKREEERPQANTTSSEQLLKGFAKSMLKWGKSGFAKVDEDTFKQRIDACAGCDLLSAIPDKLIYKMLSKKGSSGVCGSCGCLVEKKALLATDTCPEASLENPKLNRWGEPHTNM